MVDYVKLRRRSLFPICDRVSFCMSLKQNALSTVHSRQTHVRKIAVCKEYLHQISGKVNKSLFADTRYLTEVRTDGSGLHEGRSFFIS
jgi:hypothetical protein